MSLFFSSKVDWVLFQTYWMIIEGKVIGVQVRKGLEIDILAGWCHFRSMRFTFYERKERRKREKERKLYGPTFIWRMPNQLEGKLLYMLIYSTTWPVQRLPSVFKILQWKNVVICSLLSACAAPIIEYGQLGNEYQWENGDTRNKKRASIEGFSN